VRRVIAPIAAALLALTIAGPVAADPINKSQFPHVYTIRCTDGTLIPDQNAHGVPGWGLDWEPGDTPWLLMGYTVVFPDGSTVVVPPPSGLQGRLSGPCTIALVGQEPFITDAYFLHR
jgi:hypothetical protein